MSFATLSIFDDLEFEVNLEKLLQVHINEINIPSNTLRPRIAEDDESISGGEDRGIAVVKRVRVEEVKDREASKNHESRSHLNPLAARAALAFFRSNSSQNPELSTNPSTEGNNTKMTSEKKAECSSFSCRTVRDMPIRSEVVAGKSSRIKRKADGTNTLTRIGGRQSGKEKREMEKNRGRKCSSRVEKKSLLKKKGTKFSPRLNFLPRLRSQKGT